MKVFETVRGMRDFLPDELVQRRRVEAKVRELFNLYGYREIETPVLESYELLSAKAGEEIRHRMYEFKDLGGRRVALRPEMTASVARLVAGKLRSEPKPLRLGYIANCFRYDNPQMGRYREFWQAGFELFGSSRAEADAEILAVASDLLRRLGLKFYIKIGHVGILRGILGVEGVEEKDQNVVMGLIDKRRISNAIEFLKGLKVSDSCLKTVRRLQRLRGTDVEKTIESGEKLLASNIDALASLNNLKTILKRSVEAGVSDPIYVDLGFTRGLDYYTGMIFELYTHDLNIALGGGGRYDRLVESFGGEPTPSVGCSPGIDRIVLAMNKQNLLPEKDASRRSVFVVPVNETYMGEALRLASDLRVRGVSAQNDVTGRGLGEGLSYAAKLEYPLVIIIGSREVERGIVTLRDLRSKIQKEVQNKDLVNSIREMLNGF
jgi:histidyl-tRNA synthetase